MKSYVIGASGFLGRHLSAWFARHGSVHHAPPHDTAGPVTWEERVLSEMRRCEPNVVFLPGASQAMGDDGEAIHSLIKSNCVLPCLVANELLAHLPETRLVTFGSSWQFADSNQYRPFNLYAASKQAGQDMLAHYALRGLKVLSLLLFDTYGEKDSRRKLLNLLQDACAGGKEIGTTVGEQEIDLVHIDDVCSGVELAMRDLDAWDTSQGVLVQGLGSGRPIRVKELINRVELLEDKPLKARIGERSYRSREVMQVFKHYVRPTGWSPLRTEFHAIDGPADSGGRITE